MSSLDCCSSAGVRPIPTSGAGWQLLERSRRRFELTHNPRHLKYESYSKPEATHFQLRIIWLLSIVTQPLQSGSRSNGWWTATELGTICRWLFWYWTLSVKYQSAFSTLPKRSVVTTAIQNKELSQYHFQPNSWLTRLLSIRNNDKAIKNWVRTCPPFEYCPEHVSPIWH